MDFPFVLPAAYGEVGVFAGIKVTVSIRSAKIGHGGSCLLLLKLFAPGSFEAANHHVSVLLKSYSESS